MKKIFWFIVLTFMVNSLYGQFDSIYKSYTSDFEAYKKSADEQFNAFKAKRDSAFQQFLNKTWRDFEVYVNTQPIRPKPHDQPIITIQNDTISRKLDFIPPLKLDTVKRKGNIYSELDQMETMKLKSESTKTSFNFFGIETNIIYPDILPQLKIVNEESIDKFYTEMHKIYLIWAYNLSHFKKTKEAYKLNDWGYYLILKKAAESLFSTKNNQTLFIWYCLINSGYQVKIAFNNDRIYLMIPSKQSLANFLYIMEDEKRFYLFGSKDEKLGQLRSYEEYLDRELPIFSFILNELPILPNEKKTLKKIKYGAEEINFEFNTNLIDFLDSYPSCALDIYFKSPISNQSIKSLNHIFIPLLEGKKDRDKVNILLDFVQKAFAYKTDMEQFGKERYFFADESLYYPYTDCEDRSVLLAKLIEYYTGLETIVLDFPLHIALAVHIPNEEIGNYILFEGKKYLVCDPTYIGSKSGTLAPELFGQKLELIKI